MRGAISGLGEKEPVTLHSRARPSSPNVKRTRLQVRALSVTRPEGLVRMHKDRYARHSRFDRIPLPMNAPLSMLSRLGRWVCCAAVAAWAVHCAWAGHYSNTVSPGNVPWPEGIVPYVVDPALSLAQQRTYRDALRDFELAANVQFIPRTTETQYVFFKYNPVGPNAVSGSNPQIVEINLLTRGQVCHEMAHSFGLLHEQTRSDRDGFVNVLSANISAGNAHWFDIDPAGMAHGAYDFESVLHFGRDLFSVSPGVLDTLQARPGFERFQPRMSGLTLSPGDRAVMRHLYGTGPVLSPVVTNTSEGGVGSLRAALHYALEHPGTTITFNIPETDPGFANGVFTIRPTSHLPVLVTDGTIIDATTQPGYAGSPRIVLEGSLILPESGSVPGLMIYAANCAVRGLSFQRLPWVGLALLLPDAVGNTIAGCWFGVDHTGEAAAPNALQGIQISDGASGNTIGGATIAARNVLSGNTQYGVWISGANTSGNVVAGNYIGTNASGAAALANGFGGVIVTGGAHDTTIGPRNVLSGNVSAGVWITGVGVNQNVVRGNLIGTNAAGTAALPNTFAGMYILDGASNNTVSGNVISGNFSEGLRIAGVGATGNVVRENFVGTSPDGASAIPNGFAGVAIYGGATGNLIGGAPGARNVISGNASYGVAIADPGTDSNSMRGNTIGMDATGAIPLPNGWDGVALFSGAQLNMIGGIAVGDSNLIAGNGLRGVALYDAITRRNSILGNSIDGNGQLGIGVFSGANDSQAAPSLTAAVLGVSTGVTGSLSSTPSTTFRIEFFSSPAADPFGFGEGLVFLGATNVATDGAGGAVISVTLAARVRAGHVISATATNPAGSTSDFSQAIVVSSTDSDGDGMPDLYESSQPGLNAAVNDAALDLDRDGFSNIAEFRSGTAPGVPTSHLRLIPMKIAGSVVLDLPTVVGITYRIEKRLGLTGVSAWSVFADNVIGTGGTMSIPDPAAGTQPRAFYRAVVP